MNVSVFGIVLLAALLHAGWNALVKGGLDKTRSMAAVVIGQGAFGGLMLLFVPAPAIESWSYLLIGVALHLGYQMFLISAYKVGDLTQVYPIARGIAPVIVTVVSVTVLGVGFDLPQLLAVGLIVCGIISLGLVRSAGGTRGGAGTMLALITGCFIAAYSLNDGLGARLAGSPLGFYGWMALLNAAAFAVFVPFWERGALSALPRSGTLMVVGGGASFAAYALVVYAFTLAPIALVTALRETSIVFALLIGVFKLKERLDLAKVFSTFLTLIGVALLRLSKG
ncbi:EamA family transporter [Pseudohalocynthiibacter aestuariivivens]|nr:EamA family transporter [Pseudohalocynthiibacter aestuariivivens]QIE46974.1 EamA family transporter [Pseudohalocynthiibacter aestuariivivens]